MSLYENIICYLNEAGVDYQLSHHQPVFTSATASQVSNHPEEEGTKTLALQSKNRIIVVTVSGVERLNFRALAKVIGVKKLSMCKPEIIKKQLKTEIGGLAPFGYDCEVTFVVSRLLFIVSRVYMNPGKNNVTLKVSGKTFESIMNEHNAIVI